MKFGVSISSMVQVQAGEDMERRLADVLAFVHEARDLGFEYVSIGQHYVAHPYQTFQPIPLLARLAAETGSMRLHTTILFCLHNPVGLAEHLATLDVITGGRLTVGAAIGYREEEYAAFGVDPKTRVSRTMECLEAVRRLWTEDSVTMHGRHVALDGVRVPTKPVQKPHPLLWIAANGDAAVRRAARLGVPWHINPHANFETIARQVGLYRETAREAGQPWDIALPMNRELYCAETTEQALEEAAPYLGLKYTTYAGWGQDKALPGDEDFTQEFRDLLRDRFTVGSPEDCVEQLRPWKDLGVGLVNLRMTWAGMPLDLSLKGMRLVAERVVPQLR